MLDFTSALYLGLRHPAATLRTWTQLTVGRPAALGEPPASRTVAARLAALTGCERALVSPSTLHLFWDLFGTPAFRRRPIFVDSGAYPIARWGAERARCEGSVVTTFRHHDPGALRSLLARSAPRVRPIILCDGLCPACGGPAPVREYLALTRDAQALLLIDDTQALGILGEPAPGMLYGTGGGGCLRRARLGGGNVMVAASLAKGFGVPIAMLAGESTSIEAFEHASETRVHCSPASAASVSAAERALDVNEACGDRLRTRLADAVMRFRRGAGRSGIRLAEGTFPVQTIAPGFPNLDRVHAALLQYGVRTVLHRDRHDETARLSFIVTAAHSSLAIDRAVSVLAGVLNGNALSPLRRRSVPERVGNARR